MQQLPDPLAWLAAGIPLTLLIDLLDAEGPRSRIILERERAPKQDDQRPSGPHRTSCGIKVLAAAGSSR